MSLVAATAGAVNFHPRHEKPGIRAFLHHLGVNRLPEAWPAGAAIELMFRGIGGQVTARTCLLFTSDAADQRSNGGLGGRRIIKKKKNDE